ncbi:MAG: signal peptidase I, partial [Candidatus Omnitrophica bacterium]|nr:signal peptidase I [Candidatus Omnitrophota bacterium]
MGKKEKDKKQNQKSGWKAFVKEWVEPIVFGAILALLVRTFVLEIMKIPTGSMEPTLHGDRRNGDKVLVLKFTYWFSEPKRWDVLVFLFDKETLATPNLFGKMFGFRNKNGEVIDRK